MALHRAFEFLGNTSGGPLGAGLLKTCSEATRRDLYRGALFLSVRTSINKTGISRSPGDSFKGEKRLGE